MTKTTLDDVPHGRDDAPWTHGGDTRDADFGTLFARPAAGLAVMLSFDRAGRRHAPTLFDGRELSARMILHGRWFDIADHRDRRAVR